MGVWTADQARTAILRKQGLLDRFQDPLDAMRACTVIQTQYAVSLTPALFARAHRVSERRCNAMLTSDRSLAKTWAHRATVHTLATEDHPLIMSAIGGPLGARFHAWMGDIHGERPGGYEAVKEAILAALAEGPLTRQALHGHVPALREVPYAGWGADVKGLAYEGRLVFAEQGGARTSFASVENWLGGLPSQTSASEATAELLRRYLAGYGPATLADFRIWTMLSAKSCRAALNSIRDEMDEVRIEGREDLHFVMKGETAPEVTPSGPRLLAKFDPLLMMSKDRSLFLEPKFTNQVIRIAGQIEACVLLASQVAGVWRLDRKSNRADVVLSWFGTPRARERRAVEREAQAVGRAMGYRRVDVVERAI